MYTGKGFAICVKYCVLGKKTKKYLVNQIIILPLFEWNWWTNIWWINFKL